MKTYLEAINDILFDSGDDLITTLDLNDEDILSIYNTIIGTSKEILSNRFDFNYNKRFELTKDSNNEIELPDFLNLDVTSDNNLKPRKKGGNFYLYNLNKNTFDFSDYKDRVYCDIVFNIDFENIPFYLVQQLITKFSSYRYYMSINGYDNTLQIIQQEYAKLRTEVETMNSLQEDANMFHNEEIQKLNNQFINY